MKNSLLKDYIKKNKTTTTTDFSNTNNVIQPQYGMAPKKTSTKTKIVAGTLAATIILGGVAGVSRSCSRQDNKETNTEVTSER